VVTFWPYVVLCKGCVVVVQGCVRGCVMGLCKGLIFRGAFRPQAWAHRCGQMGPGFGPTWVLGSILDLVGPMGPYLGSSLGYDLGPNGPHLDLFWALLGFIIHRFHSSAFLALCCVV